MVQAIDDARRRARQGGPRVPPHNLDAEQSLLGAMLLSRDAIAAAVEFCRAEDFYKPAHAHIFDAITTLYSRGEPADPVTVADELGRAGLLDAAGGLQALVALQADTPATTNAGRYAEIVEEHALLRRLIGVAGEIAEMGYSVPEDVTAAVDQAEALVFDIAERRVTDSLKPLQSLLMASLDRLESLYTRGEMITGVPTGYIDLDERLYGLQPSSLVIVGARPAMGKALALDTPIPTPDGWTTMGSIEVGDRVFDESGSVCTVTYVSPVYRDRTCYLVEFDDGSSLVADAEHQWSVSDNPRLDNPKVVTTQQMVDQGVRTGASRRRWHLRLTSPLDLQERELPVDPYVLGCWIGNGHKSGSGFTIGDDDVSHFVREFALAGYPLLYRGGIEYGTTPLAREVRRCSQRVLSRELDEAGLLRGAAKHIPAGYLRASFKQRLALLQGILDTDGDVDFAGRAELCLTSRELCSQIRELVCSLGHKPDQLQERTVRLLDGRQVTAWRLAWTPLDPVFRLELKAEALLKPGRIEKAVPRYFRRAVTAIHPVESVPVRCITVNSPSHLYLAGESMIPTHNTSFALGIAAHAAVEARVPTLVFSLEMGHEEITQRLLVSEARIDAGRIRNGRLAEADWPKISQAVARLSDAPLFIDDNPNLTVMEIRAKARRLKAREGNLGLIIVDYLQLMSSRSTAENRQLEVSSISRGLKVLARELEVPVVALSQLSRNLEMRADKRPVLADLRESGCMPASTRLLRADTGEEVTLGELVLSQEQPLVWALDDRTMKLVPSRLVKAFPSGIKPVYRLRLRSGYEVEATANHKFRTIHGWQRLDEIAVGDHLAVPAWNSPVLAGSVQRSGPVATRSGELVALAESHGEGAIAAVHSSDVFWDEVVEITPIGTMPTFDATVDGTHNFIANGVIAHNSLEQDADVVMFLYRDEMYNPESADRGTAEVIVAKHRNGPTGKCQLAFLDHHTRFANMARV
jgi:replicative DNA helicase